MQARLSVALLAGVSFAAFACSPLQGEAQWPPLAKKWFDRAQASYRQVDVDDAQLAIENAMRLEPHRPEVRLLAARVALAQLEYDEAVRALEGIDTREALAIRGRAHWYAGRIDKAADELEQLISDPEVRDAWATEVAKLARRGGGREPFRMTGGLLGVTEMPYAGAGSLIVPVELDGEPVLSLIATGTPEVVLDSASEHEPTWISLRFGERIEVKDVPAIRKDLSGVSKQLAAPIKLLLGVNLLRHVHPTIDYRGSQFVVRTFDPPPPPQSTTVKLSYIRGGGMVFRGGFGNDEANTASLLVDTSMRFPIALDAGGWKKAGISVASLQAIPNGGGLKQGVLPTLRLGAFDVPEVPSVWGAPLDEFEKGLDIDLDGLVGGGLLGAFRVTIVDGGRNMWLEDAPAPSQGPAPSGEGAAAPASLRDLDDIHRSTRSLRDARAAPSAPPVAVSGRML